MNEIEEKKNVWLINSNFISFYMIIIYLFIIFLIILSNSIRFNNFMISCLLFHVYSTFMIDNWFFDIVFFHFDISIFSIKFFYQTSLFEIKSYSINNSMNFLLLFRKIVVLDSKWNFQIFEFSNCILSHMFFSWIHCFLINFSSISSIM